MADIRFLVDDYENGGGEQDEDELDGGADDNSMLEKEIPEEFVSPLTKMDRYLSSEIIFNRRMAARYVLECLRSVKSDDDCYQVLQLMVRLSDDLEAAVRVEVMEQIPHVAVLCVEHRGLPFAVPQYILPVVVRYLTDPNNQVRKTSQAALLLLLEQEVIERVDVEQQICPVLIELCSIDSTDDFRTEAVTLMSKMAPMVGREITEQYFLGQFDNLCSDPLFHVRKVCAGNFGEMCEVIGNELTEKRLLPVFMKLCQDGVWGVRKACAECFMNVSTVASKVVRRNDLAPLFISLLGDKSRWVQMAAYQSLGPFISTFAEPNDSGFFVDEHGKLCKYDGPVKSEGESSADQGNEKKSPSELLLTENNGIDVKTTDSGYMSPPEAHLDADLHDDSSVDNPLGELDLGQKSPVRDTELQTYNSFNFWRMPLPSIGDENSEASFHNKSDPNETSTRQNDIDNPNGTAADLFTVNPSGPSDSSAETTLPGEELKSTGVEAIASSLEFQDLGISDMDIDDDDCEETVSDETALECDESVDDSPKRMLPLSAIPTLRFDEHYLQPYSPSMCFDDENNRAPSPPRSPRHEQLVIPQALLDHYISMTEPSKAQAIDTDLAKHCAFSFPAVALTLGAKNWSCLRDTYELLSSDMQWKVRRTLAFSIHELSQILGESNTRVDLVPIFNNFLKDLDEVRIGVLKHLAKFIKLLAPDLRSGYLPTFSEFLNTDNARNWRFRYELAEQLIMLADVYQASEVSDHICPIALTLGADRVAEVRQISYKLVGILLLKLSTDSDMELRTKFTQDIMEHFAGSPQCFRRLSYCQLCEVLLEEDFINAEKFAIDFLPHLLTYQGDRIVNVKLALSRTLTRAVMVTDYFCRPECKDSEKVLEAIETLQSDEDRDVRYYAGRDEEVPYEGQPSDDPTIRPTASRESLEDETMVPSPLDGEFAEKQIEAKLMAIENTHEDETKVTCVPLEVGQDEGFEDADRGPSDGLDVEQFEGLPDESDQQLEGTGYESFAGILETGAETEVQDKKNESCAIEEKAEPEDRQNDGEKNSDELPLETPVSRE